MGDFGAPDGKLVIEHDIGGYAGAFAKPRNRESQISFEEWTVCGARVWFGVRTWSHEKLLVAVTFPDNGYANFYAEVGDVKDAQPVRALAGSFQPNDISTRRSKNPYVE